MIRSMEREASESAMLLERLEALKLVRRFFQVSDDDDDDDYYYIAQVCLTLHASRSRPPET